MVPAGSAVTPAGWVGTAPSSVTRTLPLGMFAGRTASLAVRINTRSTYRPSLPGSPRDPPTCATPVSPSSARRVQVAGAWGSWTTTRRATDASRVPAIARTVMLTAPVAPVTSPTRTVAHPATSRTDATSVVPSSAATVQPQVTAAQTGGTDAWSTDHLPVSPTTRASGPSISGRQAGVVAGVAPAKYTLTRRPSRRGTCRYPPWTRAAR